MYNTKSNLTKLTTIILILYIPLTANADIYCDTTSKGSGVNTSLPIHDKEELIAVSDKPLLPNGEIVCHISSNYSSKNKTNGRYRREEGTYQGVKYSSYYSSGISHVQGRKSNVLDYLRDPKNSNWKINCDFDEINDTHTCNLFKQDLSVGIWHDNTPFVLVGHGHYPNSDFTIRTNKNTPHATSISTGFSDSEASEIIHELIEGKSAVTRYKEWPYDKNEDKKIDLFGFAQAWELLNKIYSSARIP